MAEQCGSIDTSALEARLAALEQQVNRNNSLLSSLATNIDKIFSAIEQANQSYQKSLEKIFNAISELNKDLNATIRAAIQALEAIFKASIADMGESIRAYIAGLFDFLKSLFGKSDSSNQEILNLISSMLSSLQGLKGLINSLGGKIDNIQAGVDGIRTAIGSLRQFIGEQLADLLNAIPGALERALKGLNAELAAINSKLEGLFGTITTGFGNLRQWIGQQLADLLNAILGRIEGAVVKAVSPLKALIDKVAGKIDNLQAGIDKVKAGVDQANKGIADILRRLGLLSLLEGLKSLLGLVGAVNGAVQLIQGAVNTLLGVANLLKGSGCNLAPIEQRLGRIEEAVNIPISGALTAIDCEGKQSKHGYSGAGLKGVALEISALMLALNKQVESIGRQFPTISGVVEVSNCKGGISRYGYSGKGFKGLELQSKTLALALGQQACSISGGRAANPATAEDLGVLKQWIGEQLADLLNALLEDARERIGEFPVEVPESIITPAKGFFDSFFSGKGKEHKRQLSNVSELIAWNVDQIESVIGHFHQSVEIEDVDLTIPGNQTKKVVLPNVAETLVEIFTLALQTQRDCKALIACTSRNLLETGMTRKEVILAQDYAKANADFLAYRGKTVTRQIPTTFTLPSAFTLATADIDGNGPANDLAKLLKESKTDVLGFEFDDNDDLHKFMMNTAHTLAILRAAAFRRVGSNIEDELMSTFRDLLQFEQEGFGPDVEKAKPSVTRDFSDFTEMVETGFVESSRINDSTKPYGRDFAERPRVVELGDSSDSGQEA